MNILHNNNIRIGLMGGTFDPIHFGHLNSAEEIADIFKLQQVIFIPLSSPPHKHRELTHVKHRLNMTMIGVLSNPRFNVSDIEIKRGGTSFTIDTIRDIKKNNKYNADLFFITGSDAFYDIGEWKEAQDLFRECNFIVNARPGFGIKNIADLLKKNITDKFGYPDFVLVNKDKHNDLASVSVSGTPFMVNAVSTTGFDISSSKIRTLIRAGKSVKYMVTDEVECYIKKMGLYCAIPNYTHHDLVFGF